MVGVEAQKCWANGVLIDDYAKYDEYDKILAVTKQFMDDPSVSVIYEAGFECGGVLIRADIIERHPDNRWVLYEVKFSTGFDEKYLEEITLQGYIMLANKIKLAELYLVHLYKEYVHNGVIDYNELFVKECVTDECRPIFASVPGWIEEMHGVLALSEAPEIRPSHHCEVPYPCEF